MTQNTRMKVLRSKNPAFERPRDSLLGAVGWHTKLATEPFVGHLQNTKEIHVSQPAYDYNAFFQQPQTAIDNSRCCASSAPTQLVADERIDTHNEALVTDVLVEVIEVEWPGHDG